jgi:hypothetical protein
MNRTKSLTIAAILQFLLGIANALGALPILAAGSVGLTAQPGMESVGGPPFWAGVLFLVLAVAMLFGAYGLWVNQKWGKVLTIITCVVTCLFGLGDVVGASLTGQLGYASAAVVGVLMCVFVVFLVLRREPKLALAA